MPCPVLGKCCIKTASSVPACHADTPSIQCLAILIPMVYLYTSSSITLSAIIAPLSTIPRIWFRRAGRYRGPSTIASRRPLGAPPSAGRVCGAVGHASPSGGRHGASSPPAAASPAAVDGGVDDDAHCRRLVRFGV